MLRNRLSFGSLQQLNSPLLRGTPSVSKENTEKHSDWRAALKLASTNCYEFARSDRYAGALCVCLAVHWFIKEFTSAYLFVSYNSAVWTAMSSVPEKHDTSAARTAIYNQLWVTLFVQYPIFCIVDPWINYFWTIHFRTFLTNKMMREYYAGPGMAFYGVKLKDGVQRVDNPDERIAQDVKTTVNNTLVLVQYALGTLFSFGMWVPIMFRYGGKDVLILAAIKGSVDTLMNVKCFAGGMASADKNQYRTEADFRATLFFFRDFAESIALAGSKGPAWQVKKAQQAFSRVVQAARRVTLWYMLQNLAQSCIEIFTDVYLNLFWLPFLENGAMTYGDFGVALGGFSKILKVFDVVPRNIVPLTTIAASTSRIEELLKAAQNENETAMTCTESAAHSAVSVAHMPVSANELGSDPQDENNRIVQCGTAEFINSSTYYQYRREHGTVRKPILATHALCVRTPGDGNASPILDMCSVRTDGSRTASVIFEQGEKGVLVLGTSGVGKSTLVRALCGLWRWGSGRVYRPPDDQVLTLAARVYLPQRAALLEQVAYPDPPESFPEHEVVRALQRAQLGHLIDRWGLHNNDEAELDCPADWAHALSMGEQQRVGVARILLRTSLWNSSQTPEGMVVILDEATGNMDVETETAMYRELCNDLWPKGGLVITVTHRPEKLIDFHSRALILQKSKSSQWDSLNENSMLSTVSVRQVLSKEQLLQCLEVPADPQEEPATPLIGG